MPRVVYARVNRRAPNQGLVEEHGFREEMQRLAQAGEIRAQVGINEWIGADLTLDPSGDFLSGIVGYEASSLLRTYDDAAQSWKKGATRIEIGAQDATLCPFAVDIRDEKRWIAFAPTGRIQAQSFSLGFGVVLSSAAAQLGLMPGDWEVSLIPARARVYEWIEQNPDVAKLVRIVLTPNPGRDLSGDLEDMRAIGARRMKQEFTPYRRGELRLGEAREILDRFLEGMDEGNVEIRMEARHGATAFNSRDLLEHGTVDSWGSDWDRATDLMLRAVRDYSEGRGVANPMIREVDDEP